MLEIKSVREIIKHIFWLNHTGPDSMLLALASSLNKDGLDLCTFIKTSLHDIKNNNKIDLFCGATCQLQLIKKIRNCAQDLQEA